MIDVSRLTKKSGDYSFASRGAVTDRILLEVAEQYETEVSNRFIGIKPADLSVRYGPDSRILETRHRSLRLRPHGGERETVACGEPRPRPGVEQCAQERLAARR